MYKVLCKSPTSVSFFSTGEQLSRLILYSSLRDLIDTFEATRIFRLCDCDHTVHLSGHQQFSLFPETRSSQRQVTLTTFKGHSAEVVVPT